MNADNEISTELKENLDKKITTNLIECLGNTPEAIKLMQKTSEIKTYEDYYKHLNWLESKYQVRANGIHDYLQAIQDITSIHGKTKNKNPELLEHTYEAILHHIGDADKGILYYSQPLSLKESQVYSQKILQDTGKLVFPITPETELKGKIITQEWEGKKGLPLVSSWEKETDGMTKYFSALYTQYVDKRSWTHLQDLNQDCYGYRFRGEDQKEYLVLSPRRLENLERIDIITGLHVSKTDKITISGEVKLKAYTNILHLHNFYTQPSGYKSTLNIVDRLSAEVEGKIKYDKEMKSIVFGKYRHPDWFETLILAWLLSSKHDDYPLHLFIFQEGGGCGKTTLLKRIAKNIGISESDIWSGNKSTIKSLVPNYGSSPPDCGWMPKQRMIGLLDEFFGRQSNQDAERILYQYDSMKDELVHSKSAGLSGKGKIATNTTAKFLFMSNLKYGIKDLESFMRRTDEALVERMLVYFINTEHQDLIKESREQVDEVESPETVLPPEFIKSVVEWCNEFTITCVDYGRMKDIRNRLKDLDGVYDIGKMRAVEEYVDARMNHHLFCLLDGLVKLRYISEGEFTEYMRPNDVDYYTLEMVSQILSKTWITSYDPMKLSEEGRVGALSEEGKELYFYVKPTGRVSEEDASRHLLELFKDDPELSGRAIEECLSKRVLRREEGEYRCFWYKRGGRGGYGGLMGPARLLHELGLLGVFEVCDVDEGDLQLFWDLVEDGSVVEVERGRFKVI